MSKERMRRTRRSPLQRSPLRSTRATARARYTHASTIMPYRGRGSHLVRRTSCAAPRHSRALPGTASDLAARLEKEKRRAHKTARDRMRPPRSHATTETSPFVRTCVWHTCAWHSCAWASHFPPSQCRARRPPRVETDRYKTRGRALSFRPLPPPDHRPAHGGIPVYIPKRHCTSPPIFPPPKLSSQPPDPRHCVCPQPLATNRALLRPPPSSRPSSQPGACSWPGAARRDPLLARHRFHHYCRRDHRVNHQT